AGRLTYVALTAKSHAAPCRHRRTITIRQRRERVVSRRRPRLGCAHSSGLAGVDIRGGCPSHSRWLRRSATDTAPAHQKRPSRFVIAAGQLAARTASSHFLSRHRAAGAGRSQPCDRSTAGRLRTRRVHAGSFVSVMTQSKSLTPRGTIFAVTSGKGGVGKTNV